MAFKERQLKLIKTLRICSNSRITTHNSVLLVHAQHDTAQQQLHVLQEAEHHQRIEDTPHNSDSYFVIGPGECIELSRRSNRAQSSSSSS